jgi:hypothetical protein
LHRQARWFGMIILKQIIFPLNINRFHWCALAAAADYLRETKWWYIFASKGKCYWTGMDQRNELEEPSNCDSKMSLKNRHNHEQRPRTQESINNHFFFALSRGELIHPMTFAFTRRDLSFSSQAWTWYRFSFPKEMDVDRNSSYKLVYHTVGVLVSAAFWTRRSSCWQH